MGYFMPSNSLTLIGLLIGLNALAIWMFFFDKRQAKQGGWRVPENTLLGIAILGGSLGAKYGQYKFRHKTKKQPFGTVLNTIIVLQILLICALILPQTRALLLAS